jgi:tubulin polyglutamylase TTLL6/13
MKPENMCQGQGISLISKFQEIEYVTYRYIIQEYIENPYLIDGLKWDLRLYVLLCGSDPLRILLYKEGMARFATVPYKKPSK